ncbi:phage tail tape measure protein [Glutamicibacter nicotianae]|uniref:phage tail tape measure protein n=1 Tax=Glutamicibacter nicotianae TaxID=37929 RepID=UPI001958BD8E|nr:phage tail tape measure protein [Glutamicibacter nicotianae]MBM7767363.1 phage-related minor tail protein [Glutamicibacter nicotianae]
MGEGIEDVTGAVESVISSIDGMRGASEADIEAMARAMSTVAGIAEEDVTRAAQVAGQMITTGFAKDGIEAADMLTVALQQTPKALRGDLLDAIDEYGPMFQQLGFSGEQAMSLLVDASAKGMYGIDKTGDAVKEFSIRATDMSKATGDAYAALGMDQEKMTAALLKGGDDGAAAFQKIIGGLQDMKDPVAQSEAALALFGTPIEDLSTAEIPKFISSLSGAGGTLGEFGGKAAAAGEEINGGPGHAVKELSRTVETTFAAAVEGILPTLTPILDFLTTMAPVLGPLALGLAAFAAAIWLVQGAMAAWNVIQLILNATLWASPITWVIAAVIALIAVIWLIVANWEEISAWLVSAGEKFAAWWGEFWAGVGDWISEVWGGFVNWIKEIWGGFFNWLKGVGKSISSWWNGLWSSVGQFVSNTWNDIISWIKAAWAKITSAIQDAGNNAKNFLSGIWNSVKSTVTNVWNSILDWFRGIPGKVLGRLNQLAQLGAKAAEWFGKVKTAAVDKFNDVVSWVKGVPNKILSALGSVGNLLANAGKQILQGFLDGLKQGFENVKNFVGGIGSWIADHKGPKAYDLALLVPAGGWIMEGLGAGIEASMPALASTLGDVSWMIANGIDPELNANGSYAFTGSGAFSGEGKTVNVTVNQKNYNPVEEPGSKKLENASSRLAASIGAF